MEDRFLHELYKKYFKYVYRLASNRLYAFTGSSEEVQDVVQEVFLLAAQKEIHNHPNPGGWLTVATNNICMNYGKAAIRKQMKTDPFADGSFDPQPPYPADVSDDATKNVDFKLTLKSVLTMDDYEIIVDHYINNRSLAEIAADLGVSHATLRVRLHRIRKRLKKYFFDM